MDSLFRRPDFDPALTGLEELRRAIWAELTGACGNLDHPWRLPNLASLGGNRPHQRILVLRSVLQETASLIAHTDIRSPKVEQIRRNPLVSWLFYDPQLRIQIVMQGTTRLHVADEMADQQWELSSLTHRIAFLAERAPGTPSQAPSVNLPEGIRDRVPTVEESALGRSNFAVIACDIQEIDLLLIRSSGNIRAHFARTSEHWKASWLDP